MKKARGQRECREKNNIVVSVNIEIEYYSRDFGRSLELFLIKATSSKTRKLVDNFPHSRGDSYGVTEALNNSFTRTRELSDDYMKQLINTAESGDIRNVIDQAVTK